MANTTTGVEIISDERIGQLKAWAGNDAALLVMCDLALGLDVVVRGPFAPGEAARVARAMSMTKRAARAECARFVANLDRR